MRQPSEDKKEADSKDVTSRLATSQRDSRFLNFVTSWVLRYNQDRHAKIMTGSDFTVDFKNLGLHPLTPRGREFVDYLRNRFK